MENSRSRNVSGTQFHHIIPRQVYTGKLTNLSSEDRNNFLVAREFLNEIGFTADRTNNVGILLPTGKSDVQYKGQPLEFDSGRSEHRWSKGHARYNRDVAIAIADFSRDAREVGLSNQECFDHVHDIMEGFRQDLRQGFTLA